MSSLVAEIAVHIYVPLEHLEAHMRIIKKITLPVLGFVLLSSNVGAESAAWLAHGPSGTLSNYCASHLITCIVDQTSQFDCSIDRSRIQSDEPDVAAVLDSLVQQCPMYRWRKINSIYIFEPKEASDSELNTMMDDVRLGPLPPAMLIQAIVPLQLDEDSVYSLLGASNVGDVATVSIPKGTVKNGLIEAARQVQPSYWAVLRNAGPGRNKFTVHAESYAWLERLAHAESLGGPGSVNDPARLIAGYCELRHATCVIDRTSRAKCDLQELDMPNEPRSMARVLDAAVKKCSAYHWRVSGNVYVFEPKDDSESALNVKVGPLDHQELDARGVMRELAGQAGLHFEAPHPSRTVAGLPDPLYPEQSKRRFNLPPDTMKNDLIAAAEQLKSSCWGVVRGNVDRDGTTTFNYWAYRAYSRPRWSSADPATAITNYCISHQASCVVDQTSARPCILESMDMPEGVLSVDGALDAIVRQCPAYHWRKSDSVYIFEPKVESDSLLAVKTGPITKEESASALIDVLAGESHFRHLPTGRNPAFMNADSEFRNPGRRAQKFSLPRDTFKNDLIMAAKQLKSSCWGVARGQSDREGKRFLDIWAYSAD